MEEQSGAFLPAFPRLAEVFQKLPEKTEKVLSFCNDFSGGTWYHMIILGGACLQPLREME